MGLALVMVEEHARAAVHLRNNHPLGAVDDERAVLCHQRHVAHVDVLLLDVADRARAGVLVDIPHDQAQRDLQRRGKGDAALLALIDLVFLRFQLVAHEFELCTLRKVADREHRSQHFLQADIGPLFGHRAHLQKMIVRTLLDLDQVRHRRDLGDASEAFADAFLTRKGYSHHAPRYGPPRRTRSRFDGRTPFAAAANTAAARQTAPADRPSWQLSPGRPSG